MSEDIYRECLASVAPAENARRIGRDGVTYKFRQVRTVDAKTIELLGTLEDGECSTAFVAEAHAITTKSAGQRLSEMQALGWVLVVGKLKRNDITGGRYLNIWAITDAGKERLDADT